MPRILAALRRLARWLPAFAFLFLPLLLRAQDGADPLRPKHLPARVFSLPFTVGNDPSIRQVKLYVSADNGTTWVLHATATPAQRSFDVRLDRDGSYAFAIQTIKSNNDALPASLELLRPSQYVVIDTEKPVITLQALAAKPTPDPGFISVGVQWDVYDVNLDPRSVRLEVRWAGQGLWQPITDVPIAARGEDYRKIDSRARMEVRLSARDYAGNEASKTVMVGAGLGSTVGLTGSGGNVGGGIRRNSTQYRLVNKKDISLEFAVREKGPSGIAGLDLWMTTNRQDWQKIPDAIKPPTGDTDKATAIYAAKDDGLYGFTVIGHSRAGLAQPEPKKGDEPQFWVEIDTKPPEAKITDVRFTVPNDARMITVFWTAQDEHIDAAPIFLEYKVKETDTSWKELAYSLPNTGKYTFKTPQLGNGDFQFFIKMRVVDRAGNQTEHIYEKPIIVDLIRPHVEITDAMPAKP